MVPSGWKKVRVENLGGKSRPVIKAGPFGSALTKDCYVPSGYKIYGQEQVISGDPSYGDYYISEEKFKSLSSCSVKSGDILISLVGTAGKVLVIPDNYEPGVINPRLLRLSLDHNKADCNFIKYYLVSTNTQKIMLRWAQGGTMGVLNADTVKKLPVCLPPLPEQKKIARILSTWDKAIETVDKLIENSQQQKKALMQQLLTGNYLPGEVHRESKTPFNMLPTSWKEQPLFELCENITKGSTPTTYGFPWQEDGIPFLRSECVGNGEFIANGLNYIGEDANTHLSRSIILPNDILITITGYVGRTCKLPPSIKQANINQHIARIRVSSNRALSDFIYQVLLTEPYLAYYNKITTGQAYPQISLKQVRETVVPIPPIEIQKYICTVLSKNDDIIAAYQRQIGTLIQSKQSLMQQLLTGKRRVQVS